MGDSWRSRRRRRHRRRVVLRGQRIIAVDHDHVATDEPDCQQWCSDVRGDCDCGAERDAGVSVAEKRCEQFLCDSEDAACERELDFRRLRRWNIYRGGWHQQHNRSHECRRNNVDSAHVANVRILE